MAIQFKEKTLSNGLTIIAEVEPAAHSAAVGFFVKTGARDEDTRLMGVSHFLEHMMFKGTDELSADDVNRGFDDLGARNNAFTSNEMTCFYAHVLPEHLLPATELVAKMMRPALRQDDFDTEKNVILEEIAMYEDNPFWVLYEEAIDRHYRPHPLRHRVLGTKESITDLKRDEMMGYFTQRYSADNTVVSLAGNLDFDRACDAVERLCGDWDRTGADRDNTAPKVSREKFEMFDDKVSRGYLLGIADGPSAQDDRRYAATLAAQVLGAGGNSRLHWALVETGIAEEAMAAFDAHDGCGNTYVYASGEPDRLAPIADAIDKEIAELPGNFEADDLERLRSKALTAATVGGEKPHDRMQRLGRLWTTIGEYRPLEEELDKLAAVTVEDCRKVAEEFPLSDATRGTLRPAP
ncbi:MAG: pitrilysin family protein [Planctomycetota bacterium]